MVRRRLRYARVRRGALLPRERRRDCLVSRRLPLSPAATSAVDGPGGCGRERQDEGRDAAGCFCWLPRPQGARNAADGKIASLVSPRISMSGFSTERPPAGPHSAPRAHGDNVACRLQLPLLPLPLVLLYLGLPHLLNLSKRL